MVFIRRPSPNVSQRNVPLSSPLPLLSSFFGFGEFDHFQGLKRGLNRSKGVKGLSTYCRHEINSFLGGISLNDDTIPNFGRSDRGALFFLIERVSVFEVCKIARISLMLGATGI